MSKRKEVYVYNDTKRDNRPECHALSCFYSHHRVEKKKQKKYVCVSALSHPHRGGVQILGWRQNLSL